MSIKKFVKDPSAILDYTLNWTDWLKDDNDTISEASVPSPPSGITIQSIAHTTTTTTVWIAGGTAGTSYDISIRIHTAGNRQDERTITISCKDM